MIGYYVHHQGSGHLHRALSLAPFLQEEVTGLSSLPRPRGWLGDWIELPRDDGALEGYDARTDTTAGGRLHWVPLHDNGLRERTAVMSAWIGRAAPRAVVVDQSMEVCLLARLHGVPVVAFTAPGRRADPAHLIGFDSATALVGAWPDGWSSRMLPGLPPAVMDRFEAIGGVSRFAVTTPGTYRDRDVHRRLRVILIAGTGGDAFTADVLEQARRQTPDWDWTVLSRRLGTWHEDPAQALSRADVAIIHPGQNSLAEVASRRLPAVVVPQPRPFDEQHVTACALRSEWPAVVLDEVPTTGWRDLLHDAVALDGSRWAGWCDGLAGQRFARVMDRVLDRAVA